MESKNVSINKCELMGAPRDIKTPKIVSWLEYTSLLKKLFEDIQFHEFDAIVGIGRGGSIIAAYLASKLGHPTFYPLFIRHVGRGEQMKIVAHDLDNAKKLRGRILIVDDWLCEGRAMRYILKNIPTDAIITTLVMFRRTGSEFKPDYVGTYVDADQREILFPYDLMGY